MTTGKRILIVDESALVRRKVRLALEPNGWHVLELASPVGAARTMLRHAPDVILLDVPPTDNAAAEVEEVIQASRALHDTVVLLFSVRSAEEMADLVTRCGVSGFVEKSADDSVLISALNELMGS